MIDAVEHRRDIAIIEFYGVIVALFGNERHADGRPLGRQILFQHQGEPRAGKLHGGIANRQRIVIRHILLKRGKARQRVFFLAEDNFFPAAAAYRQGQYDFFAGDVIRKLQRRRALTSIAKLEERPIRQQAAGIAQSNAALTQHRLIKFNFKETPQPGAL